MRGFFSPAKINLFLRVVSKRSDGFHNLSSVLQTISFGDVLSIEHHDRDHFTCTAPHLPLDSSNLVIKALELYRKKTGLKHPLRIHLNKKIPIQAGLGGGSSNAATALWAFNALMKTHIPCETLKEWGAEIGSDIPFFFSQGTAYCTGRGENVHSLPSLEPSSITIIKPTVGLSTPEVFRRLNMSVDFKNSYENDLKEFSNGSLQPFNDLESPAFLIKPELQQLKTQLLTGGFETVLMAGAGSSFLCLGKGTLPLLSDVGIFTADYMNRLPFSWYQQLDS